ncbi:MAG: DHH family phosphoesterase [Patescibacteria group bacterium]|jgi:nanoRNase/pAp phosphatase (c-di-AMP/oligoRNAs hydrolase)
MERTPAQQSIELIEKSKNIIIALPSIPSTDAVAAGLGLFLALEKIGKKVKVVCSDFSLPPSHQFLPKSKEIHTDLTVLRKFIISLDLSRTRVQELSYNISQDSKLDIFITPKGGFFEERDVTTSASSYEYDLIVVLDAPELETLGKVYDDNTDFFYHTPIVNIDHNPANEYFGEINVVDLVATSTSEIVFELFRGFKEKLLDEYIATSLLTGIISKTKSFQSNNVTPKSLAISSHLIENGARRDDIIKNLYRTKSINTLKLWGRALARLKTDAEGQVVWTLLNKQDFQKSGAGASDLEGVIDELIINTPKAEIIMVIYESNHGVEVIVNTSRAIDGAALFKEFHPTGTRNFTKFFIANADLLSVEQRVLIIAKGYMQGKIS